MILNLLGVPLTQLLLFSTLLMILTFSLLCLSSGLGGGLHIDGIFLLTNLVDFALLASLDPKSFFHLVWNFGMDLPRTFLFGTDTSQKENLHKSIVPLGNESSA